MQEMRATVGAVALPASGLRPGMVGHVYLNQSREAEPMNMNAERLAALVRVGAITEERACRSKVAYYARNHAKASAKEMARKTGGSFNTYRCPYGDHWHLSNTGDA